MHATQDIYVIWWPGGPYWDKLCSRSCVHRLRTQFFSIQTSRPSNNFFFIYLFLLKLLSALLVANSLLSAGGQDGKIPPAHETNQITGLFLSCPLARPPKKWHSSEYFLTNYMWSVKKKLTETVYKIDRNWKRSVFFILIFRFFPRPTDPINFKKYQCYQKSKRQSL